MSFLLLRNCALTGGRGEGPAEGEEDEGSSSKEPLLLEGLLGVFDLKQRQWLQPQVTGQGPSPRSSARAVALSDRVVIYGGAAQGDHPQCVLLQQALRSVGWLTMCRARACVRVLYN